LTGASDAGRAETPTPTWSEAVIAPATQVSCRTERMLWETWLAKAEALEGLHARRVRNDPDPNAFV